MSAVTCPRCDARWGGLKAEHCTVCHLTFSSTEPGDRHLVDMDPVTGKSRHLTADEMAAARSGSGNPRFVVKLNAFGTPVWGRWKPTPHPHSAAVVLSAAAGTGVPRYSDTP